MLWLVNEHDELLLARRADHIKFDPGLWGPSVTGKFNAGETAEQALLREADEELSLKPDTYDPIYLFEVDFVHPDGDTRQFSVYMAKVTKTIANQLTIDLNEVAEIKWLSISEIKDLLNTNSGRLVVPSATELWHQIFDALENHLK